MKNQILKENFSALQKAADDYHVLYYGNGGSCEFDMSINDISRHKIELFKKIHGSCILYKLNKWKETDPDFFEYTGQKVLNFSASFMTATTDELLCQMVVDYNKPKGFFDSKKIMHDIKQIFARLAEIEGVELSWS